MAFRVHGESPGVSTGAWEADKFAPGALGGIRRLFFYQASVVSVGATGTGTTVPRMDGAGLKSREHLLDKRMWLGGGPTGGVGRPEGGDFYVQSLLSFGSVVVHPRAGPVVA